MGLKGGGGGGRGLTERGRKVEESEKGGGGR